MNGATNLERIQAIYSAFGEGDIAAALDVYAPDAVVNQAPSLPYGGRHLGRAAIEQSITTLVATWDELRIPVSAFIDAGDVVVVREHFHGRARSSGVVVEMPMVEVFMLAEGRVVAVDVFYHDTAALVQALACT